MTNAELIAHLQTLPPNLPVEIKTYGSGFDSWTPVTETMIQDMTNEVGTRIVEIAADWN